MKLFNYIYREINPRDLYTLPGPLSGPRIPALELSDSSLGSRDHSPGFQDLIPGFHSFRTPSALARPSKIHARLARAPFPSSGYTHNTLGCLDSTHDLQTTPWAPSVPFPDPSTLPWKFAHPNLLCPHDPLALPVHVLDNFIGPSEPL